MARGSDPIPVSMIAVCWRRKESKTPTISSDTSVNLDCMYMHINGVLPTISIVGNLAGN